MPNELTEEEAAARRMNEEFGDFEFELGIAERTGPIGRESISADRATVVPTGGRNIHARRDFARQYGRDEPFFKDTTGILGGFFLQDTDPASLERYANVSDALGEELEADTVYAVGVENATPGLFAHEFRHRNLRGLNESSNRIIDAYRASTPSEWKHVVRNWQDVMERFQGLEDVSLEEAEEDLLAVLDEKRDGLAKREARADTGFAPDELDEAIGLYKHLFDTRQRAIHSEDN